MNISSFGKEQQGWKPNTSSYGIALWCTAFSLISIAILCANAIAIAVFEVTKSLRKKNQILMLNLAFADLLIGGIALPLYVYIFYKSARGYPWRSRLVNEIYICVDIFAGVSSMFLLAVIALERVFSVFCPFKHRTTPRKYYWYGVMLVWVLAICLASLKPLSSRKLIPIPHHNVLILTLVSLSIATIIVSYICIWRRAYSVTRKENCNVIVSEKSIVQAMLFVTIMFIIMWMPIYLLNVVIGFEIDAVYKVPLNVIYLAKLLQYFNSVVNPIIYSIKIPAFRKALRRLGKTIFQSFSRTV